MSLPTTALSEFSDSSSLVAPGAAGAGSLPTRRQPHRAERRHRIQNRHRDRGRPLRLQAVDEQLLLEEPLRELAARRPAAVQLRQGKDTESTQGRERADPRSGREAPPPIPVPTRPRPARPAAATDDAEPVHGSAEQPA